MSEPMTNNKFNPWPMPEPAYTEQELVEQLVSAITNNEKEFSFGHQQIREALQEYGLAHIRSYTSEARAGMREACAEWLESFVFPDDVLLSRQTVRELPAIYKELAATIRKLPDLAADEAIERIKREARLSLTADLAAMVNYRYLLRDVTERLLKYAENVYPRCPDDSERELEAAEERKALIADAKTILYETGIAALSGKETEHD